MDFEFTPEQEAFRKEVRLWLAEERCAAEVPPEHRVAPDHTTRCVRVADGSLWASPAP